MSPWRRAHEGLARLRGVARSLGLVGGLIARADEARDARCFREAAILYAEVLRRDSGNAGIHMQRAHMLKAAGDAGEAELHYRTAAVLRANQLPR